MRLPCVAKCAMPATATVTPLEALNHWAPIVWLKTNPYAYPTLEVAHIIAIALVFGTLWIVDVRILGGLRSIDVRALTRGVLPWTLAGFTLAAVTGLTMFISRIGDLIGNPMFIAKICLLFLAGANAAVLHARGIINPQSKATRAQALLSIVIWLAVIFCGRWIAYV
jgi:hypothetical protein